MIYYLFFAIDSNVYSIYHVVMYLDEKISVGTGSTININNPNINASISKEGVNSVAAALSSAGGTTVGLKVAQYVAGPPAIKVADGVTTMVAVQTGTAVMSRILNHGGSSYNNVTRLMLCLNNSDSNTNDIINNYPLDLLPQVDLLLICAIIFICIIIKTYIVRYIINLEYSKYLPKNKFGDILNSILDHYIKLWVKTSKYILILSYFMLFFCIIVAKLAIYVIINYYN